MLKNGPKNVYCIAKTQVIFSQHTCTFCVFEIAHVFIGIVHIFLVIFSKCLQRILEQ